MLFSALLVKAIKKSCIIEMLEHFKKVKIRK